MTQYIEVRNWEMFRFRKTVKSIASTGTICEKKSSIADLFVTNTNREYNLFQEVHSFSFGMENCSLEAPYGDWVLPLNFIVDKVYTTGSFYFVPSLSSFDGSCQRTDGPLLFPSGVAFLDSGLIITKHVINWLTLKKSSGKFTLTQLR